MRFTHCCAHLAHEDVDILTDDSEFSSDRHDFLAGHIGVVDGLAFPVLEADVFHVIHELRAIGCC